MDPEAIDDCISASKLPLKEHQERIVRKIVGQHGVIAAFDTGTGKTLTAVTSALALMKLGLVKKTVVVSPKSLISNFRKELGAYGADPQDDRFEYFTIGKFEKAIISGYVCDESFLVIDEAHELRTTIKDSGSGIRAFSAINACIRASRVLLLTATPIVNDAGDLINLVAMATGTPPVRMPPTEKTKKELFDGLFSFHAMADDSPLMPKKVVTRKRFIMSPDYLSAYMRIQRQLDPGNGDPFVFLSGLRRATNSIPLNPKVEWTISRITSTAAEERKIVIYSGFIGDGVKKITAHLDIEEIQYRQVTGEMTAAERSKSVADYNSGEVRILIVSRAGSLGLDLKGTRDMILLESSWNPAQEDQTIGRAVRIGSHLHLPEDERSVEVFHLSLHKPSAFNPEAGACYIDLEQNTGCCVWSADDPIRSGDCLLDQIVEEKRADIFKLSELVKSVSF